MEIVTRIEILIDSINVTSESFLVFRWKVFEVTFGF